jgi:peptidoglycan/xylan/chitin deacetylase (PgdA/CDA1 family)
MRGLWLLGGLAGLHVGTAATWLPAVRRCTPRLAGLGRSDHLALTFDDGPAAASTPRFLELLDRAGVRATFFLVGQQLAVNPALAGEIAAAGHEVAVHGYAHRYLLGRNPRRVYDDLAAARDLIGEATGALPTYFRPPYGVLTTDGALIARQLGLRPIIWTSWGKDWTAEASAQSVYETLRIRGGATLLLHDADRYAASGSWRATLAALPRILDRAAELRLTVGPLHEHGL